MEKELEKRTNMSTIGSIQSTLARKQMEGLTSKQIIEQLNEVELPEGTTRKQASEFIKELAEETAAFVHYNQSGGLPGGPILEPSLARRFIDWLERRFYSN